MLTVEVLIQTVQENFAKSDDGKEQRCYFNIRTNDKLRNTFISKTLKDICSHTDSIQFQIEQLLSRNENN